MTVKNYRESCQTSIENIIMIANDVVKHPLNIGNKNIWHEPCGLDLSGRALATEWSAADKNHCEIKELYPSQDLQTVYRFLENIAKLYSSLIAPPTPR